MNCSRCNKRPAVVFITKVEKDKTINEGLCLICAKELGVKPVDDLMKKMGITEDDLEAMTDQISEFFTPEDGAEGDDSFSAGGSLPLPFMQNLGNFFSGKNGNSQEKEQKQIDQGEKQQNKKDNKKQKLKFLDTYCQNLTEKARSGNMDIVVGREKELYRLLQILNRRTKNNPCLIGEPGVGKTAIAESLALKIAQKNAPAALLNKEVYLLDLTALIAGTQFRGQFEGRVKGLVEEVKRVGNVILVIDEVHNLVGGGDAEGSMNAANMLKPALSRGEVQVIGATTLNEYRKHIEKDAALERRFQPIIINEPSIEDTVEILHGIKNYYEVHHNIKIPNDLIRQAVIMSERYVTDRFLPDKAIDLIDEACSNAALSNKSADERILVRRDIAELGEKLTELDEEEDKNYEEIAKVKAEILQLTMKDEELSPAADSVQLTMTDLAFVIELWTGIPATKIQQTEAKRLTDMEVRIKEKIVGQDEAVALITNAVKRARANLVVRKRPVSFIFIGPTGVGKTELVKVLARQLYDSPESLIRLDMSEFMEKHSVSRIIGSPPGYVGYDEAGQLTEKIRRKPYSVILFDEIEKAHPDVLNILLQILDDGRITDAHGKTVNFENTFIVMTSNAGSDKKGSSAGFNKSIETLAKDKAMKALSEFLRPEFLNRVDEVVAFSPLPKEVFKQISVILLSELIEGLEAKGITLTYDDNVTDFIADKSYSREYGARNIRRVIQKEIEDKLVDLVLEGSMPLKNVHLTTDNETVNVSVL